MIMFPHYFDSTPWLGPNREVGISGYWTTFAVFVLLLLLGVIIPLGRQLTFNMTEANKISNTNVAAKASMARAARNVGAFVAIIAVAACSQAPIFMLSVFAPHLAFFQAYYFPAAIMPVGGLVFISYLLLCVVDPTKVKKTPSVKPRSSEQSMQHCVARRR